MKKSELTEVRERFPLVEKNLLEVSLRIAAKQRGKNDNRRYSSKDAETEKRMLQNENIQKVTQKVWKPPIYRRPKP